ncbi:MAG: ATP-binding protein [Lentisphaeria bacterium]
MESCFFHNGKSHLAKALAYEACKKQHSVLCVAVMNLVNTLIEAATERKLEKTTRKYAKPQLLVVDELDYISIDRTGSEFLFQVFAKRYDSHCASIIITTNRAFKEWTMTFDKDAILTSAVLDRILPCWKVVVIEGKSYRMRKAFNAKV